VARFVDENTVAIDGCALMRAVRRFGQSAGNDR
jgi:hypothetical protein